MILVRSLRLISLCLLAIALGGCINLPKGKVKKHYYAVESEIAPPAADSAPRGVLQIQRPEISPAFKGRGLVYRIGGNQYESDYYNEYFAAPEDMIHWDAVKWFSGHGQFDLVSPGRGAVPPDFILSGLVNAVYFDVDNGRAEAVLESQWTLTRVGPRSSALAFNRMIEQRQRAGSRTPQAMIEALNRCLTLTYQELASGISEAKRSPAP
jgi:ABC-type uncharacterized transport system auxiliary subunit